MAPGGQVTSRLVAGPAGPAVLEQARDAELIVLGCRGLGQLRGLVDPSVAVQVVTDARCPVAVVHPFHAVAPGPSAARVVVGVGASPPSEWAVGYGFQAAAQRGIGLTVVHAGTSQAPGHRELLKDALAGWGTRFPAVVVEAKLVRGGAADVLVAESAGAAVAEISAG